MNESLDPALVEAYALAPASVEIVDTLELSHPSISQKIYLVSGQLHREFTLDGEQVKFNATGFRFSLPATDEGGLQELEISIDNVQNKVTSFCETALQFQEYIEIRYRPYRLDDPTKPMMDPPLRLFLEDVRVSDYEVSGRANPINFLNLQFPNEIYTRSRFPGLGN